MCGTRCNECEAPKRTPSTCGRQRVRFMNANVTKASVSTCLRSVSVRALIVSPAIASARRFHWRDGRHNVSGHSQRDAKEIKLAASDIHGTRARGYGCDDIAAMFADMALEVSATTIPEYLRRVGGDGRLCVRATAPPRRQPRSGDGRGRWRAMSRRWSGARPERRPRVVAVRVGGEALLCRRP